MSAQPIILFNPEGRTANYIIPGLVAVLLQMIAVMLASASRSCASASKGTMEQLWSRPSIRSVSCSASSPRTWFSASSKRRSCSSVMRFGFGVAIRGSLLFLFAVVIVYVSALLSLGLFISTRAKTQQEAQQKAQMLFLPSIFLSGYIFPLNGMPFVMQVIGQILPTTHMVAIMRGIVLRDAGPLELVPHLLALLAFAVVMITLSVRRMSRVST